MAAVQPGFTDPELYLRLEGERTIPQPQGQPDITHLGAIATAFVAAGLLPAGLAMSIVDDYNLAVGMRQTGFPLWMPTRQSQSPATTSTPPTAPVVTLCRDEDPRPDGSISYAVLGQNSTELAVTYTGTPDWQQVSRRFPRAQGFPHSLSLRDDTGRELPAQFNGGGGNGGWSGRFVTAAPLSQQTKWLELGGRRVTLVRPAAALQAQVEPVSSESPIAGYLRHRIAVSDHGAQLCVDDPVIDALLATGALTLDDPVLAELNAIRAAMMAALPGLQNYQVGRMRGSVTFGSVSFPSALASAAAATPPQPDPVAEPPEQWRPQPRVVTNGPVGIVPLGVATPLFGDAAAILIALTSAEAGFRVDTVQIGGAAGAHQPYGVVAVTPAFAWWAKDDRGGWYRGQWQGYGGTQTEMRGNVHYGPALDPLARRLRLMPTLPASRVIIDVPLPEWEAAP